MAISIIRIGFIIDDMVENIEFVREIYVNMPFIV